MQMPGGVPGGGMVRVGIERDIRPHFLIVRVNWALREQAHLSKKLITLSKMGWGENLHFLAKLVF